MSETPLVSVIMPTYNNERDITLAIASVLTQDYPAVELVIVNDASTDCTPKILERFAAGDPRLVLLHNERNLGRALSRNRAIEAARGDLIAILDADDIAMPDRLGRQVAFMQAHPDVGILGSWAIAIDSANRPLEPLFRPVDDTDIRQRLRWLNMPFVHSTVMLRRQVALAAGLYDARFAASQDFHLCYRVVQLVKAAALPEFLTLYRVSGVPGSTLVNTRYRWAIQAGWDLFKRYPNLVGALSLTRFTLLSLLPGSIASKLSSIHKDRWNRELLAETQVAAIESWLKHLSERIVKFGEENKFGPL